MRLSVTRFQGGETRHREYDVAGSGNTTLLAMLQEIKTTQDSTLAFRHACGSGICGSCSVRIDGRPVLACRHKPVGESAVVEPLESLPVLRDLIVDETPLVEKQRAAKTSLHYLQGSTTTPEDKRAYTLQSSCIECASCYSVCPVNQTDSTFMGPWILTKALRYLNDPREGAGAEKLEALQQQGGIWDCVLCGDCAMACPMGINSKMDITILQSKSQQAGYSNPNPPETGGGFGFGDGFTPSFS